MSRGLRLWAVVALTSLPAVAGEWSRAFAAAVDELPGGDGLQVLVAGAGTPTAEVHAAAEGLREVLRTSGRVALVLGDSALGSLTDASDEEVRAKAAPLPWSRLIIVRTVPGVRDQPPSAVVVISNRAGATLGSLVVPRVAPRPAPVLVPAPVAEPVAAPVVEPAVEPEPPPLPPLPEPPAVVEAPPPPPPVEKSPAELEYERRALKLNQGSLQSKDPWVMLRRGVLQDGRRLEGAALYRALGRDDFLARVEGRRRVKVGLGVASGALAVVGAAGLTVAATTRCVAVAGTKNGGCLQYEVPKWLMVPSGVLGGLGVVGAVVAIALPSDPVGPDEVVPALRRHDEALRRDLGLSLRVAPSVTPDGASLAVWGRF